MASLPGTAREVDSEGQPTQRIVATQRYAAFITPIPR